MVTEFIQEVFRTKLRNYNFKGEVNIHCFQADQVLIGMVKQLFPNCKIDIVYDKLNCFEVEKILGRDNKEESVSQKIMKWWNAFDWNDKEMNIKQILELNQITQKTIQQGKGKK